MQEDAYMPSDKRVIAFRASVDEEEMISQVASDLNIPRSRVLGLALRIFKERVLQDDSVTDGSRKESHNEVEEPKGIASTHKTESLTRLLLRQQNFNGDSE